MCREMTNIKSTKEQNIFPFIQTTEKKKSKRLYVFYIRFSNKLSIQWLVIEEMF